MQTSLWTLGGHAGSRDGDLDGLRIRLSRSLRDTRASPSPRRATATFFRFFAKRHPKHNFPTRSVLFLGLLAAAFCVFQLGQLVTALVVIRILLMFGLQAIGVVVWRILKPNEPRPFRMWLYPLPVLITLAGFALVLHDEEGALSSRARLRRNRRPDFLSPRSEDAHLAVRSRPIERVNA